MTAETLQADGWRPLPAVGFSGLSGPFWARADGALPGVGFVAGQQHSNGYMGTAGDEPLRQ